MREEHDAGMKLGQYAAHYVGDFFCMEGLHWGQATEDEIQSLLEVPISNNH